VRRGRADAEDARRNEQEPSHDSSTPAAPDEVPSV
jgi:hypothetical protein